MRHTRPGRARTRARHFLIIGAVAVGAAFPAIGAATVWGPYTVSIPSTGGWNQCGPDIPGAAVYASGHSYQGTRHPYQVAVYTPSDSVAAVSPQISNDGGWGAGETGFTLGRMRIDNQASSAGNGGYSCNWRD